MTRGMPRLFIEAAQGAIDQNSACASAQGCAWRLSRRRHQIHGNTCPTPAPSPARLKASALVGKPSEPPCAIRRHATKAPSGRFRGRWMVSILEVVALHQHEIFRLTLFRDGIEPHKSLSAISGMTHD